MKSLKLLLLLAISFSISLQSHAQYKPKQVFRNGDSVFVFMTAWKKIPTVLQKSATLDFGSTSAATSADLTITVTGATVGDAVSLGLPAAPDANTSFSAFVSATNTVTVRFNNYSSGAVNPASGTYYVLVTRK